MPFFNIKLQLIYNCKPVVLKNYWPVTGLTVRPMPRNCLYTYSG